MKPGARGARWGLLGTALLLGAALLASSWVSYRDALALGTTLSIGQAEGFFRAVRMSSSPGRAAEADFARVLAENRASGLRWVGLVEPGGRVLVQAGEPSAPPSDLPREFTVQTLPAQGRVRVTAPPPPRPGRPPPWGPPPGRPPPGEGPPPDGAPDEGPPPRGGPAGPPVLAVEFEPVLGTGVAAHARRNLVMAGVAAGLLVVAAVVLFRLSERADAAERDLYEQRHLVTLGEMSSVLAHEIRNPLAALKGHAQLLSEELPADGKERGRAERIVREASRLEALSEQLLDLSRSGKITRADVAPAALLAEVADEVAADRIDVDVTAAPAGFSLDPDRMRQVLVNLLRNAVQASPDGGRVEARVASDRGELTFEVRDHGPGVPAAEAARMFEPFHTTRIHGTGLGLTIARRVVELHGGTLTFTNHPDGGALFCVRLPRG